MAYLERWRERYFWWRFRRLMRRQVTALLRLSDAVAFAAASVSAFSAEIDEHR